jgi:hypothetical protein
MATLQKPDGSLTSDLNETVKVMIDHIIPNDEQTDNTDYHKRIRDLSTEPILTTDDSYYTPAEVKNAIDDLNHKKGDRGRRNYSTNVPDSLQIISYIYLHTLQRVPEERMFPGEVEKS